MKIGSTTEEVKLLKQWTDAVKHYRTTVHHPTITFAKRMQLRNVEKVRKRLLEYERGALPLKHGRYTKYTVAVLDALHIDVAQMKPVILRLMEIRRFSTEGKVLKIKITHDPQHRTGTDVVCVCCGDVKYYPPSWASRLKKVRICQACVAKSCVDIYYRQCGVLMKKAVRPIDVKRVAKLCYACKKDACRVTVVCPGCGLRREMLHSIAKLAKTDYCKKCKGIPVWQSRRQNIKNK